MFLSFVLFSKNLRFVYISNVIRDMKVLKRRKKCTFLFDRGNTANKNSEMINQCFSTRIMISESSSKATLPENMLHPFVITQNVNTL